MSKSAAAGGAETKKIKRLKLWLIWLLLFAAFLILTALNAMAAIRGSAGVVFPTVEAIAQFVPFGSLSAAALSVLTIGLVFNWWIRAETTQELHRELFSPHVVENVLSDARLREIIPVAIARFVGDSQLGRDVFELMLAHGGLLRANRRETVRYTLTLENLSEGDDLVRARFYRLTYNVQYERHSVPENLYFVCVDQPGSFNRLISGDTVEWIWSATRTKAFPFFSGDFFRVANVEIDGMTIDLAGVRAEPTTSDRIFSGLSLGPKDCFYRVPVPQHLRAVRPAPHHVAYKVELYVPRLSHVISIPIREASKNVFYSLDFSRTDIVCMTALDVLTSRELPRVERHPRPDSYHAVTVQISDQWVLPKSGVVFVWEVRAEHTDEMSALLLRHITQV